MPRSTRNDLTWTRWSFFGRTSEKLAQIRDDFGFATSTDLDAVLNDSSVDLVDICLPTRLHADVAVRVVMGGTR
jgi:predicted dehydrogenase